MAGATVIGGDGMCRQFANGDDGVMTGYTRIGGLSMGKRGYKGTPSQRSMTVLAQIGGKRMRCGFGIRLPCPIVAAADRTIIQVGDGRMLKRCQ